MSSDGASPRVDQGAHGVRPVPGVEVAPAPGAALSDRVLAVARRIEEAGRAAEARELRDALEAWRDEQRGWTGELARQLGVHHEINNALVGVRGNVQLLLMGPAAETPGVRDRLQVVLRESDRIRDAAGRLHALKAALTTVIHESGHALPGRAA